MKYLIDEAQLKRLWYIQNNFKANEDKDIDNKFFMLLCDIQRQKHPVPPKSVVATDNQAP